MQVAESDASLCQQFVTLKTAVRFAQWRVRSLELQEEEASGDLPPDQQSMWGTTDRTDSPLSSALSAALSSASSLRAGGGLLLGAAGGVSEEVALTRWQRFMLSFS